MQLPDLVQKVRADASQYYSELNKVTSKLKSTGKAMTLGLSIPIALMGASLVKSASDAQETSSKFETVFSSISAEASAMANVIADSYGLASTESKKLLGDTGDLLTGFGFSQKSAFELSKQVNTLAVDLASFTNLQGGAKRASEAITAALLGERERMKLLGVVIRETDVQQRLAAKGMGKLTGQARLQAVAQETLQIAYEQSKNAIGDFNRTQSNTANQIRITQSKFKDMREELGNQLIPLTNDLLSGTQGLMDGFSSLDETTKRFVLSAAGLTAIIGPLAYGIGALVTGLVALNPVTIGATVAVVGLAVAMAKSEKGYSKKANAIDNERLKLINLTNQLKKANITEDKRKKILEEITVLNADLAKEITKETNALKDLDKLTGILTKINSEYQKRIDKQLKLERVQKNEERVVHLQEEITKARIKGTKEADKLYKVLLNNTASMSQENKKLLDETTFYSQNLEGRYKDLSKVVREVFGVMGQGLGKSDALFSKEIQNIGEFIDLARDATDEMNTLNMIIQEIKHNEEAKIPFPMRVGASGGKETTDEEAREKAINEITKALIKQNEEQGKILSLKSDLAELESKGQEKQIESISIYSDIKDSEDKINDLQKSINGNAVKFNISVSSIKNGLSDSADEMERMARNSAVISLDQTGVTGKTDLPTIDYADGNKMFEASRAELEAFLASFKEVSSQVSSESAIIETAVERAIGGFAGALGQLAVGVGNAENLALALLSPFADMAIRLGELAISIGLTIQGIKESFKTMNPGPAIIMGGLLIGLGTALKGAISSIGSGGGAGGSSYGGFNGSGSGGNIGGTITMNLNDLRIFLEQNGTINGRR